MAGHQVTSPAGIASFSNGIIGANPRVSAVATFMEKEKASVHARSPVPVLAVATR